MQRDRYPDGTWFVDLSPLTEDAFVVTKLATLFDVRAARSGDLAALVHGLQRRHLLLVLDNCEHLLDGTAAVVAALLRASPEISILATSRQRLNVAGETTYRLPSLTTAPKPVATAAEGRAYSAIDLFAQRAAALDSRFRFNDETAGPIGDICSRLDGIPLAIELAAARVSTLGLLELRTRITRHLDVLRSAGSEAPARQRTLVATFEWSYDLLAQPERVLLRRLAIFAGGCTLEAAEQVSAGNHEFLVCETLASLVEKSLAVAYLQGNVTRYRLLDSTRAFALEKLAASGEREVIARSHADWMASFADRADKTYQVEPRQGWMTKVEGELNDARAALEWALRPGGDAILAGRIAGGLGGMWRIAGLESERRQWVAAALERVDEDAHPAIAARLLRALAGSLNGHARIEASRRALALCERIGDRLGAAGCWTGLGYGLMQTGEAERGLEAIDRSRAIYREENRQASLAFAAILVDRSSVLRALGRLDEALADLREAQGLAALLRDETILAGVESALAEVEFEAGNVPEALRQAQVALSTARRSGVTYREMNLLCQIACFSLVSGDVEAAQVFAQEALTAALAREPQVAIIAIHHLAAIAALHAMPQRAARLLGYVERGYERETYAVREPTVQRSYEILVAALREQLPERELAGLVEQGASLQEDVAAREAMLV
jgi:predicted ATPase